MPPIPFTRMRRQDRAVEDQAWIEDLLKRALVCSLALSNQDRPSLHFNSFVYDPRRACVYIHGAQEGGLPSQISLNNRVSLGVQEMGRLLPGKTAMAVSVEFASVILRGSIHLVQEVAEAKLALQQMLDKYFPDLKPGLDYREITPDELAVTNVYRVDIQEWSGKQKRAGA